MDPTNGTGPARDRERIAELEQQVERDRELIRILGSDKVVDTEKIASLMLAVETSRQIGTAIGVLMHRRKITSDAAFVHLVKASQATDRELRDIAIEVIKTGALPEA